MNKLSVVEYLTMRYLNERETKRLLPYDKDLVDRVQFLLVRQKAREQEERTKNTTKEHIYKIEINRIEWILSEYLLIRLEKIRNNLYIKNSSLLSPQEEEYFNEYIILNRNASIYTPYKEIAERHLNQPKPEIHGIYVLDRIEDVPVDREILSFSPGDFLIGDFSQAEYLINDLSVLIV